MAGLEPLKVDDGGASRLTRYDLVASCAHDVLHAPASCFMWLPLSTQALAVWQALSH